MPPQGDEAPATDLTPTPAAWSEEELLREKDFAAYTDAERAVARRLLARIALRGPKRRSRRKDAVAEQAAPGEAAAAEPAPAVAVDEPAVTPPPRPRRRKAAAETEAEPTVAATAVAEEKTPAPKKSRRKKSAPAEDEDA